ncbi:MAG: carbohydrate ABC transporter permease [Candidatus Bathyarchaeia archaeon]
MRIKLSDIIIYIVLTLLSMIIIFPFIWLVLSAFKPSIIQVSIPPVWIFNPTIDNFVRLFTTTDFLRGYVNSFIISGISTPIIVIVSSLAGYALDRWDFWGKETLALLFFAVWMFPAVAFAIPIFMLHRALGLLDTHIGIILVFSYGETGLGMWLMRSYFSAIPKEIDYAARLDGHSAFSAFFKEILPLARSGVVTTALFMFIITWNEFLLSYLLTRSTVRPVIPVIASLIGYHGVDIGLMMAAGLLSTLPIIIISLIIQRELIRGLTFGAIR